MSLARRKIKRIQPVIRVRQQHVDNEAALLAAIRTEKAAVVAEMRASQQQYMEGVERLNRERSSSLRDMLLPMEHGLDFVKAKWLKLYRRAQEVEAREQAQVQQVLLAQRNLMAVEKLEDKYEDQFTLEQKRADQKSTDETAIRRFNNRS